MDEKLYRAVQSTLNRRGPSGKGARSFRQDFLLRGLLRCRVCDSPMSPSWSTSRGREYRYYVCTRVERSGRDACSVRAVPAGTIEDFVVKHIRTIAADPVMLTRVAEILQRRHAERVPALEKELAQLAVEQQRCRQEGKRVLQAIGGNEARSDMTTKRLAELDARDHQLEQRMAELRDELAAAQREAVSAAAIQRAVALFDPVWDLLEEGGEPAQGVTLSIPTHMAAPSHALVLREGPKPTRPRGRIPRVARLLALAHHFEELLATGAVETQAELAELAKLTPARVTQIMNLLGLAPDIQEEIFVLPPVTEGWPAITERDLRQVVKTVVWSEQRQRWAALRAPFGQNPHARVGPPLSASVR